MGLCALALRAVVKVVVKGWLRLCMIFEIGERKHVYVSLQSVMMGLIPS